VTGRPRNIAPMVKVSYYPMAFDGGLFVAKFGDTGASFGSTLSHEEAQNVWYAFLDSFVEERETASVGAEEDLSISEERYDEPSGYFVGLVEHVRRGLPVDGELSLLLGYASDQDGRLLDHGMGGPDDDPCDEECVVVYSLVGFMTADEVGRAVELLEPVTFDDSWREQSRQLLLRLLAVAAAKKQGLLWYWT
jgi:hypothetical protein